MFKKGWGQLLVYAAILGAGIFIINKYQKKQAAKKAAKNAEFAAQQAEEGQFGIIY